MGKPWASPSAFDQVMSATYRTTGEATVRLEAPLRKVQRFLARKLKPGRRLVEVVRMEGGSNRALPEPTDEEDDGIPAGAVVAATAALPVQGCPAPDFGQAELRATEVLRQFLDGQQLADFERLNRFVSVGADTGHRYMLTSRLRRDELGSFAGRSLFNIDEGRAYCVHDWTVPAAEELLALHLFLSLPGKESYLREIPDE